MKKNFNNILILDRKPSSYKIKKILEKYNKFVIDVVDNSLEALEKIRQKQYEIIILGQDKYFNSIKLCKIIKTNITKESEIIIQTGLNETDINRCLNAGSDYLLFLPFKTKKFEKIINNLIKKIEMKNKRIITIGGGTGQYNLLRGLKNINKNITAIVTMMDSGGSSGRMIDEYGVLPPGDITRCFVALSSESDFLKRLFLYRFEKGLLKGHTIRNILYTGIEQLASDRAEVIEELNLLFRIKGEVMPITLDKTNLKAKLNTGKILKKESEIDQYILKEDEYIEEVFLEPAAKMFDLIEDRINQAKAIIIGPGDFYTSVVPNFLVDKFKKIIKKSDAKKIFIVNLMTKAGETRNFKLSDFINKFEQACCGLDYAVFNSKRPNQRILNKYKKEYAEFVEPDIENVNEKINLIGDDLILEGKILRHHPEKLAGILSKII